MLKKVFLCLSSFSEKSKRSSRCVIEVFVQNWKPLWKPAGYVHTHTHTGTHKRAHTRVCTHTRAHTYARRIQRKESLTIVKRRIHNYETPTNCPYFPRKSLRVVTRVCVALKRLTKSGRVGGTRRRDEGGGKYNPVFVAVNVVSVWRPGFPVLRLFVVYIAPAPSNYCADATPTRGVWSQIQSLRRDLSRLCRLPDRSTPTRGEGETSHLSLYITENFTLFLLLTCRGCPGSSARSGHFHAHTLRVCSGRFFLTPARSSWQKKKRIKKKKNKKKIPKPSTWRSTRRDRVRAGVQL